MHSLLCPSSSRALPSSGPHSAPPRSSSAEAAEYAGTHHRFWEIHDGLYPNQDQLGLTLILSLGRELRTLRDRAPRRAGAKEIRRQAKRRLRWRRAQRSQWDPVILHQRREAPRLLFV